MSESKNQNRDRDQHLAEILSHSGVFSNAATKDPLYNLLVRVRDEAQKKSPDVPESQIDMAWEKLVNQLETNSQSKQSSAPAKVSLLNSAWIWSAAAVLILAVTFIFHILSDKNGPVLIAVAEQTVQTITLPDGSVITLRPNSSLYRMELGEFEHRYELKGQALFDVAPDEHRTFLVQTDNAIVQVVGTKFTVNSSVDNTDVFLIEGLVRFSTQDMTQILDLEAGEASSASRNGLSEKYLFDVDEVLAWTQYRMVFSNRSVQSIISELNQHFNIQISIPDSVSNELLGGSISLESLQVALDGLSIVLDGYFTQTGPGTYRFTSNS